MTPPNINPQSILDNVLLYLSGAGFGLTPQRRLELEARIKGHPDAAAFTQYEKAAQQFLVYALALDDVQSRYHVVLNATLAQPPLSTGFSLAHAKDAADQLTQVRKQPLVVTNGAHEVLYRTDEPSEETAYPYSIMRPLGELGDLRAEFIGRAFAEDFELVDASIKSLQFAVGLTQELLREEAAKPSLTPCHSLVVVNADDNGRILWRAPSLRA